MVSNSAWRVVWALGFMSAVWEVGGEYISMDTIGAWGVLSQEAMMRVAAEFLKVALKLAFILVVFYAAKHHTVTKISSQSSANIDLDQCAASVSSESPVAGNSGEAALDNCLSEVNSSDSVPAIREETDYPEMLTADEEYFIEKSCKIHGHNKSRVCAKEMSINWFKQCETFVEWQPHFEVSLNPAGRQKSFETNPNRKVDRLVVVLGLEGTLVKTWKEGSDAKVPFGDVPPPHKYDVRNLRIEPFRVKGCVGVVRPGAREFLEKLSTFADIYIYTLSFNRNVAKRIMGVLSGGGHKLFKGLETRSMNEKGMKNLMVFERNMERIVLVDHRRRVEQSGHSISVDEFKGNPLDGYLMDHVFPIIQAVDGLDRVYVDGGRHYSEGLEAAYSKSITSDNSVEENQE
ncbi:hypothetical protein BSKO_04761 [Bryopsis sp. KO-2023]|nr:hypothetical protein BSKO_04761 [Bryopsis sp. KO-2023]